MYLGFSYVVILAILTWYQSCFDWTRNSLLTPSQNKACTQLNVTFTNIFFYPNVLHGAFLG